MSALKNLLEYYPLSLAAQLLNCNEFAFLPQFVDPTPDPVWLHFLVLGSIQKLAGIVSLRSVVKASGTFENWLGKNPGVVMISLGIRMLFSGSGVVSISAS